MITTGAADRFALQAQHLVLACASHVGLPIHTTTVAEWLNRLDLSVEDLHCGVHEPVDTAVASELIRKNIKPTALYHNCSGKHTGVLTTCVHLGEPIDTYERLAHPAQQRIRSVLEIFSGENLSGSDAFGIDGCSMPAVRMPLESLAAAGARLTLAAHGSSAHSSSAHDSVPSAVPGTAPASKRKFRGLGSDGASTLREGRQAAARSDSKVS